MSFDHTKSTNKKGIYDQKEMERLAKEGSHDNPVPGDPGQSPFEKYGNLSMFFIQDFALECMKTFFNRKGWKLVVGQAEQSVEMIPDDIVSKALQGSANASGSGVVKYCTANNNEFDFSINGGSEYTEESSRKQAVDLNKIEIIKDGIYEIQFAYGITAINDLGAIKFAIENNGIELFKDKQERPQVLTDVTFTLPSTLTKTYGTPVTTASGYRKQSVKLAKGDLIEYVVTANFLGSGSFTLDAEYTSWSLHYLKSNR